MPNDKPVDYFARPGEETRAFAFQPVDAARAITLSKAQIEHFNTNGFIAPLPVFGADEMAPIREYFDDLIDTVVSSDDRRNSYSINAYHLVCEGLYDLVVEPRILDYVQDILGPNFVAWGSQVFCKLPGDRSEIPLHQDAPYWPFTSTKSVTVWLAIDDVDVENASMEFVPGSHLLGPLPHVELALDGSRVLKHAVAEPARFSERYHDVMTAGSCSLHTDLLLHGSPPNASERRRAGLTMRYTAADVGIMPGAESWLKPTVHCRGDIPGRWPHRRPPAGEHPEKMAAFTGTFDGNPPDTSTAPDRSRAQP